jgi:hypothetical protein
MAAVERQSQLLGTASRSVTPVRKASTTTAAPRDQVHRHRIRADVGQRGGALTGTLSSMVANQSAVQLGKYVPRTLSIRELAPEAADCISQSYGRVASRYAKVRRSLRCPSPTWKDWSSGDCHRGVDRGAARGTFTAAIPTSVRTGLVTPSTWTYRS